MSEQYCRLCLNEDKWNSPVPIFEGNPFEESLSEIINNLSGIEVSKNDGLPGVLCQKCVGLITIFVDFRDTVKKNDKFLKCVRKNFDFIPPNKNVKAVRFENTSNSSNLKRRRPCPKSKSKSIRKENETVDKIELETSPSSMPIDPTDTTEVEKYDPTILEISVIKSTPDSDKSDSTIQLDRSRISDEKCIVTSDPDSKLELDRSRNLESSAVITDPEESDKSVELDKPRVGDESFVRPDEPGNLSKVGASRQRGRPPGGMNSCKFCNRSFLNSADKNDHMLLHKHLSSKLFTCRFCGMAHSDEMEVNVHCTAFHPFVTYEILKQKDLQVKAMLNSSVPYAAPTNSNNFDAIEYAEPPTKRNRNKQGHFCKKQKSNDNNLSNNSNVTMAEIHTPTQLEQTVAEIHTEPEQPAKKLKTSANKLSYTSDVPVVDILAPIQPEQPSKKVKISTNKLSSDSSLLVDEAPPCETIYADPPIDNLVPTKFQTEFPKTDAIIPNNSTKSPKKVTKVTNNPRNSFGECMETSTSPGNPCETSKGDHVESFKEPPAENSKNLQLSSTTKEQLAGISHQYVKNQQISVIKAKETSKTETSPKKLIVCRAPYRSASADVQKPEISSAKKNEEKMCNICSFKCASLKELFLHKRVHRGSTPKE